MDEMGKFEKFSERLKKLVNQTTGRIKEQECSGEAKGSGSSSTSSSSRRRGVAFENRELGIPKNKVTNLLPGRPAA